MPTYLDCLQGGVVHLGAVSAASAVYSTTAAAVTTLKASDIQHDPPVINGTAVTTICGSCCQKKQYCNTTTKAVTLVKAAGGLNAKVSIPAYTNLTCYLRDRSQVGAVDGGLCVPNLSPVIPDIADFCNQYSSATSLGLAKNDTIYQANLTEEVKTCTPCCDGHTYCGIGLQCYSKKDIVGRGGLCVPSALSGTKFNATYCGAKLPLLNSTLNCEVCDALSSAATHYLSQSKPPATPAKTSTTSTPAKKSSTSTPPGKTSGTSTPPGKPSAILVLPAMARLSIQSPSQALLWG